jgi:hypothetical protein
LAVVYLTLANLKAFIGMSASDTTYDTQLTLVLNGVEQSITTYLGYNPASASATEYYSGNGTYQIVLNRKPVANAAAVTAVYEDTGAYWGQATDPFPSTTLLTQGTDYAVNIEGVSQTGILTRIKNVWPTQWTWLPGKLAANLGPVPGCVKVTYTAGWTTYGPADVIQAAYAEAAARWASRLTGMGALTSESMDGYGISLAQLQTGGSNMGASRFLSPLHGHCGVLKCP